MKQKEVIPAGAEWLEKDIRNFPGSPFERIGSEWMLISAGNIENGRENWNTMTASWGGLGVLWGKNVAFIFIRSSRHTFDFANSADFFTLSFFAEAYRPALKLCGEKSGRDIDKAAAAGLTPVYFSADRIKGAVSFKEAKDVLVCKKLYIHDFASPFFIDASIDEKIYRGEDYHRMFIGEVVEYRSR